MNNLKPNLKPSIIISKKKLLDDWQPTCEKNDYQWRYIYNALLFFFYFFFVSKLIFTQRSAASGKNEYDLKLTEYYLEAAALYEKKKIVRWLEDSLGYNPRLAH